MGAGGSYLPVVELIYQYRICELPSKKMDARPKAVNSNIHFYSYHVLCFWRTTDSLFHVQIRSDGSCSLFRFLLHHEMFILCSFWWQRDFHNLAFIYLNCICITTTKSIQNVTPTISNLKAYIPQSTTTNTRNLLHGKLICNLKLPLVCSETLVGVCPCDDADLATCLIFSAKHVMYTKRTLLHVFSQVTRFELL
jgi:hypothetical protein